MAGVISKILPLPILTADLSFFCRHDARDQSFIGYDQDSQETGRYRRWRCDRRVLTINLKLHVTLVKYLISFAVIQITCMVDASIRVFAWPPVVANQRDL